jgi:hypothetical protein
VLRRVPELGIDFIDTADSYGPEVSERLIAAELAPYRDDPCLAQAGVALGRDLGRRLQARRLDSGSSDQRPIRSIQWLVRRAMGRGCRRSRRWACAHAGHSAHRDGRRRLRGGTHWGHLTRDIQVDAVAPVSSDEWLQIVSIPGLPWPPGSLEHHHFVGSCSRGVIGRPASSGTRLKNRLSISMEP